eukprot:m.375175 g.375175  ORF g.375175 m.375175 type:complete len:104 (-) comp56177_c0_seq3:195-506(-)
MNLFVPPYSALLTRANRFFLTRAKKSWNSASVLQVSSSQLMTQPAAPSKIENWHRKSETDSTLEIEGSGWAFRLRSHVTAVAFTSTVCEDSSLPKIAVLRTPS